MTELPRRPSLKIIFMLKRPILGQPALSPYRIYPSNMKTYIYRKTCKQICLAALFVTAKNCCLSINDNKMWYIHTREYYSAIKWNKILIYNIT